MRNRLFRAALIGALCAVSACADEEQRTAATDQYAAESMAPQFVASTLTLRASSHSTAMTEHYQVPPDFDNDIALHPYTSGLGPCPHGGPGNIVCSEMVPPSHYNR